MSPIAAVSLYMVLQFAIGVVVSRRIRTESDYILAGRNLGYVLTTFSVFATWFGAETVVGSSGRAYRDGISFGSAEPFAYGLCLVLMGLVFAGPLWRRKLTTLADLFRERFSVGTERIAALILIPSSILWAAAQIRAFGHVISTSSDGMSGELAIGIAAGFTILYTTFGGMLVDAITDVIQGGLLAIGLAVLFIAILPQLGGLSQTASLIADSPRVHAFPQDGSWLELAERWAIPVAGSVLATELVGRIIAARSPAVARRSSFIAAAMYVAIGVIPLVIGLLAPHLVPSIDDAEQILPYIARDLLPTVVYAAFAGALISAILSTVDSTLLVASSIMSHNVLVPTLGVVDERRKVLLARGGVMVFGIVAYLLARHATGTLELVEQASAFGSAGALVTICFGLFTAWGGARTAIATLVAGVAVYLSALVGGLAAPFLLSLAASLATYVLGALVERVPRPTSAIGG